MNEILVTFVLINTTTLFVNDVFNFSTLSAHNLRIVVPYLVFRRSIGQIC